MKEKRQFHHTPSLDDMVLFVEVVRTGSFHRAAQLLDMPGATLSRRIAAMEKRLGVRLLERTTRRVALSECARPFFERCAVLVDEARQAESLLQSQQAMAAGKLHVRIAPDIAVLWVGPLLAEFTRLHPDITLDLDLNSTVDEQGDCQPDLTIRQGSSRPAGRQVWALATLTQGLFAAPGYLARHMAPLTPAELATHDCLHQRGQGQWTLRQAGKPQQPLLGGRVGLNDLGLMRTLAEQGVGIAMLPKQLTQEAVRSGRLVAVLPDWECPSLTLVALAANDTPTPLAVALRDFLASRLALD
jgi:DNA-binding transcriptional LysR family regulator